MPGVKNWKFGGHYQDNETAEIQNRFQLPRPIAQYFAARDVRVEDIPGFLNPKLADLTDPYRFPGIREAAKRLWEAVANREPILIHGDYDTDGITASALLSSALRKNGAICNSFIPHRFDDGYGFTPESLEKAIEAFGPCKVLVTVDCGITSIAAVDEALRRGIDVIITDHHEAGPELPKAMSIVNPKIYPELEDLHLLSGAGAAFKLAHAFVKYGLENKLGGYQTRLEEVFDFVALGTVADIVPLLGENRIMVKYGIDILRKQLRPGVRALIESSKMKHEIAPSDITFKLAPRINAAGRVGDANIALQLLESENIVDAYKYANQLETYNRIRQTKEQEIYQEACEQITRNLAWQSPYLILVAGRDWHQGVIGIVASRLARDYNRPAIVLTIQGDDAYGSGRSITGLNLVEALANNAAILDRFGGHPMAVGVGLKAEKIAVFFDAMEAEIRRQISAEELEEHLSYDGVISIDELNDEFFRYLALLSPFGHSNTKPIYRFNYLQVLKVFPIGGNHARGTMRSESGRQIDFIAFNRSPAELRNRMFDVLASPQINARYNAEAPQLNIIDLREVEY